MNSYFLIFLGGGVGCMLRHWVSYNAYALVGTRFPYGALIVNITGSFLMGILSIIIFERFHSMAPQLRAFLLIGFLGGYTTFSAFSVETFGFFEQGEIVRALLNVGMSVVLCIVAVWAGIALGRQL